jgi:hypothetical protein
MNNFSMLAIAALAALFAAPAFAEEAAAPTLSVEQGTVMTSTGGEFVTAPSGKLLAVGERVMVGEGASASVVYANGCAYDYTAPGVYAVQATCTGGGAGQAGTAAGVVATDVAAVGIIAGVAAIGAVALDQTRDDSDFPPSPISR